MARNFTSASTHYLEYAGAAVTTAPLTLACWGRAASLATADFNALIAISRAADSSRDSFILAVLEGATDSVVAITGSGGSSNFSQTTSGITTGTWFHAGAVFASSTSRTAYLDGTAATANTTDRTPADLTRTAIGRTTSFVSASRHYWDGDLAEAAVWNVALTTADMAMLAKGFSPLMVRPDGLVAYWPVIGKYTTEIDMVGGLGMAVTGAVAAAHPRIVLPRRRTVPLAVTVGSGGGGYRHRARRSMMGLG